MSESNTPRSEHSIVVRIVMLTPCCHCLNSNNNNYLYNRQTNSHTLIAEPIAIRILVIFDLCLYGSQTKCVALLVTNCGLELETSMVPTVNMEWQLFTNNKFILEIFQQIISYYMETETSISAEGLCLSKGLNTIFIRI